MAFSYLGHLQDLSDRLTERDVKLMLAAFPDIPSGLAETLTEPTEFVSQISNCPGYRSDIFFGALKNINPSLLPIARKIPIFEIDFPVVKITPVASFVNFLRQDITKKNWRIIMTPYNDLLKEGLDDTKIFEICIDKKIIAKDLKELGKCLIYVKREKLVEKLREYEKKFEKLDEQEFRNQLLEELRNEITDPDAWKSFLQKHIRSLYSEVETIMESKKVSLGKIYIPLTVIEQKPDTVALEDENTENELDFLEKFYNIKMGEKSDSKNTIGNKMNESAKASIQDINKMNIIELMKHHNLIEIAIRDKRERNYGKRQDVTWIIIGNPGSGKTFLCSRIALLYSEDVLANVDYCLSIPCRTSEWHDMEYTRNKDNQIVTDNFIRQWLQLGMATSSRPEFREKLAKHIVSKEGEGLLLIVDSMDEFTKKFNVEQTLLSNLLQRNILTKCTLILTSRPGAWFDISESIPKYQIDFYFQVLGFSPDNRDIYFSNVIENKDKLVACKNLFYYHHEINLLSLIPVNASFFATLFRSSLATSYTLTKLYSALILYLINRQLVRMQLESYTQKEKLQDLHKGVLTCLCSIGEIAYKGVAERKLTSNQTFKLTIDENKIDSEWLGLVNVRVKKNDYGKKTKVWSFSHLTLQEFVGALWLSKEYFFNIFLITRFVVSTTETFSLFKMVMRFLCGILKENALRVLYMIYSYQLVTPLKYNELPLFHQNRYESKYEDSLFNFSDCQQFSNQFIAISSFLVETNLITEESLKKLLPKHITLYIQSKIAPNDWHNLIKSLRFLKKIHLIYFDSRFLNPEDFKTLVKELGSCSVGFIVIKFSKVYDYAELESYFEIFKDLKVSTDISFNLEECTIHNTQFLTGLAKSNHQISSINLSYNTMSTQVLQSLMIQVTSLTNIYFRSRDNVRDYSILLPQLLKFTNLQGMHLFGIPDDELLTLHSSLTSLSNLREISFYQTNAYSILPKLLSLTELRYLDISGGYSDQQKKFSHNLFNLLERNTSTLKTLILYNVESIGVTNLSPIFKSLHSLTALVRVKLEYCQIPFFKSELDKNLKMPENLVCFEMWRVSFTDKGLLSLTKMLLGHKRLRYLMISYGKLTSSSCRPLANLICTLRNLKKLVVYKTELSKPDKTGYRLLTRRATQFSIELKTSD